ncbi:MAG: hypothetical protein ABJ360_04995 [Roseobacter sp.]
MVANFLGQVPEAILIAIGIVLIGNGTHLIMASLRKIPLVSEVIWFSLGDFCWWLATLFLIVADVWITSFWGVSAAALVAVAVATLGVLQLWELGLMKRGNTVHAHLIACGTSWFALPKWVKIWLVLLNGVFLTAFFFLPSRVGEVTVIAYIATAPLLAGQVGYDAGLRRILALSHLVPWLPLLVWLVFFAEQTLYSICLAVTVAICLAFDIYDVWLFLKGDRSLWSKPIPKDQI